MPEVLKRVGRYDLLEVIGRGGAAVVYLAEQRDLRRPVALKELAPFHTADTTFAERFVAESRVAGAMSHANIVMVHEFFEDGGVPYIAMEYVPHGSLRQYVGRLSLAQIAGVLEGVLAGLSHGEGHGIVHRDLKPENLLVASDGRVKIADFGVARAYNKAATRMVVTVEGTTIGTPTYMSPEQALGADLTPATDLYSLGVVAWELLTGTVPFEESDSPVAVLYRHVHEPIPSVRTVEPSVDADIDAWLARMLAKRPEERYQSADEAWLALEDVVLELLGPRWRRQARVVLEDGTAGGDETLTPAEFRAAGVPLQTTGGAVAATETDVPAPELPDPADPPGAAEAPEAAGQPKPPEAAERPEPTIAPRRTPRRSNTTMIRMARRHRAGGGESGPTGPDTTRRRLIAGAIVLAMAAAAVGGILIAGSPAKHRASDPSAAQQARATALAAEATRKRAAAAKARAAANRTLATTVKRLGVTRTRALTRLNNEKTPRAQAGDAAAIQRAYTGAALRASQLGAQTPLAKPLAVTLHATAADYGRLAAAGRAGSVKRWNAVRARIRDDERALQGQVKQL